MKVKLSDHFTYRNLFKFVTPPILMMVFTSIYGVIDGLFISNFAGKVPFAAVNVIFPFLMILGSVGFMIGTGGTAIVSKLLGEKNETDAKRYFSLFVVTTIVCGVVLTILGEVLMPYIAKAMIDEDNLDPQVAAQMFDYAVLYGRIITATMPCFMLQNVFQSFFSTAEKPTLGFVITVVAGCSNILFDGVLVGAVKMGVIGAAIATCISQIIGAVLPIIYFCTRNKSLLRLTKPKFSAKVLLKGCTNGASEFVSNISMSVVSILYNYQLMKLAGDNGVSAYGVLMYVCFIYISIFIGYSIGTAPIIGYNYGAQNHVELKNIAKKSITVMAVFGALMTALALGLSGPISKLYVGYDQELYEMTKQAFFIFSFSFIFTGFSIFISSMFTALGNGLISALVSFLRTIVFQVVTVMVLPIFFGLNGVWASMLVAEILSTICAFAFFIAKKKKYQY